MKLAIETHEVLKIFPSSRLRFFVFVVLFTIIFIVFVRVPVVVGMKSPFRQGECGSTAGGLLRVCGQAWIDIGEVLGRWTLNTGQER